MDSSATSLLGTPRTENDESAPPTGQRKKSNREVVGRLRVRCVSGCQLAAGDIDFFLHRSSDPYAKLQLRDLDGRQASRTHRTKHVPKTLNPVWKEDFCFQVHKNPEEHLVHVEVYDYDYGEEDDFLGEANLVLDWDLLELASHRTQTCELKLQPVCGQSKQNVSGSVKLEISWIPALRLRSVNVLAHLRNMMWLISRSAHAIRVLRVALVGTAGLLMVVAGNSEWLCSGPTLSDCRPVSLQGATTATFVAALATLIATSVHFAGGVGLFGPAWKYEPFSVIDLAETELDGEGHDPGQKEREADPTVQFQVQPSTDQSFLGWKVSLRTSLFPKVSLSVIYLFTFFLHLTAFGLCNLAIFLAWLHSGPGRFLAEAFYLDVAGIVCLLGTVATCQRERKICLEAERNRWNPQGRDSVWYCKSTRAESIETGWEDWPSKLEKKATELTRPLLEARHKLTTSVENVGQVLGLDKAPIIMSLASSTYLGGGSPSSVFVESPPAPASATGANCFRCGL